MVDSPTLSADVSFLVPVPSIISSERCGIFIVSCLARVSPASPPPQITMSYSFIVSLSVLIDSYLLFQNLLHSQAWLVVCLTSFLYRCFLILLTHLINIVQAR